MGRGRKGRKGMTERTEEEGRKSWGRGAEGRVGIMGKGRK
jgi:hypothetical protein